MKREDKFMSTGTDILPAGTPIVDLSKVPDDPTESVTKVKNPPKGKAR